MSKMLKALQRLEKAGKADETTSGQESGGADTRLTQVSAPDAEPPAGTPAPAIDIVTQQRHMQQPSPGDYVPTPPANATQPFGPLDLPPQVSAPAPGGASRNAAFTQPMGGQPAFNPYEDPSPTVVTPQPSEGLGNTLLRSLEADQTHQGATLDEPQQVQPQQEMVQTVPSFKNRPVEPEVETSNFDEEAGRSDDAGDQSREQAGAFTTSHNDAENPVASLEDRLDRLRESAGQLYAADRDQPTTSATNAFDVDPYQPSYSSIDDTYASIDVDPDTGDLSGTHDASLDFISDESQPAEATDALSQPTALETGSDFVSENYFAAPQTETAKPPFEPAVAAEEPKRSTVFYGPPPSEPGEKSLRDSSRTISDVISPSASPNHTARQPIVKPQDVLSHIEPESANASQPYGAAVSVTEDAVESHNAQAAPDAVRRSTPLHRLTTAPAGEGEAVLLQRLEDPTVAGQFSQMVANMQRSFPSDVPASVLLLSEYERSETSYVASAFAVTAARELSEPILLIDGNPGQAKVSQWFEATQQNGFVECLNGNEWHNLVTPTSVERLHLLPAGQGMITSYQEAPGQFCSSMAQLLEAYRFVIVDGGHLVEQLAKTMAAHASATMLVVELGRSQADDVSVAIDTLRHHGARVLGAVATNAPPYH